MQRIIIISCLLLLPSYALSWGKTGHMVISEIASTFMSENTKNEIKQILGEDGLSEISTLPDVLKYKDTPLEWQECSKDDCKNIILSWKDSYHWHFANSENLESYTDSIKNSKGDAYTALLTAINILKDKEISPAAKYNALLLIAHLVADIHQPMHVGKSKDRGGNLVKVSWFNRDTSLHQVWDNHLINKKDLHYTEYSNLITLSHKDIKNVDYYMSATPLEWIEETQQLCKEIYSETDNELGDRYLTKYLPFVEKQLFKGGVRLAFVLNKIFDEN